MKRIYILLLCSFFVTQLWAYKPVLDGDTIEWNYLLYPDVGYPYTDYYFASGDTVISDTTYRKLYSGKLDLCDESYYDCDYYGALREDTITGRLWCIYVGDSTEILFMDLGLSVGDTFSIRNTYDPDIFLQKQTVVSIDSIGEFRSLMIENRVSRKKTGFLESIGALFSFAAYFDPHSNYYHSELLCVHKDSELTYINPDYNVCEKWEVGLKDYSEPKGMPFYVQGNFLVLDSDEVIEHLTLTSVSGIVHKTYNNVEGGVLLDGLPSGLYFLSLQGNYIRSFYY